MAEIPVKGGVLAWAREYRGLSLIEAAERLRMSASDLEALEQEKQKPSLTEFEKIASLYKLPLSTLFRRTPPKVPEELPDFRTLDGMPPQKSLGYQVALDTTRSFQRVLTVLRSEDENFFVPSLREYSLAKDPFQQGEDERSLIGISVDRQLAWNASDGFRHWRAVIELLGVSVYLQKFDLEDCRGFCVWDEDHMPAIVINKAETSENARTFTLIHEYAHLLVRKPGISDQKRANPIEAFCNRFAASFLMPVTVLRRLLPTWPDEPQQWDEQIIKEAAQQLKVSAQALALRLEEIGRAPEGFNRHFAFYGWNKRKTKTGGGYVRTRLSEIGSRYTSSVLSALERNVIDVVHASQALALRPAHLDRARAYVDRQRELASAA
jgi:Zn-dependent peptidase ImmA (M78 family)/DNA-binding XRE family transcriptional regulator